MSKNSEFLNKAELSKTLIYLKTLIVLNNMAETEKTIKCKADARLTFGTEVETVGGKSLGKVTVFDPIYDLRNRRPLPSIHSITTDKGYFLRAEEVVIEGNNGENLLVSLSREVKPQEVYL